jgi:hypothetical protein
MTLALLHPPAPLHYRILDHLRRFTGVLVERFRCTLDNFFPCLHAGLVPDVV